MQIKKQGIQTKINLIMTMVIITFMGVTAVLNYFFTKTKLKTELNHIGINAVARLSKNLIHPLWDINRKISLQVMQAEMMDLHIHAIIIRIPGAKPKTELFYQGVSRNQQGDIINLKKELRASNFIIKKKIHSKKSG